MTLKIQQHHTSRPAYIYLRQSTMAQVYHHQESTQRQYALKEKAIQLGWTADKVRILDKDLGISGTEYIAREDFRILVADVSMNKVGAVFALEASRFSRSCADWHRLLELCSLSRSLIIDEDGCYDPSDFNDRLLLGLKGTMSAAELHFIRARLQGGKDNKAKKGELRFPLPVGFCYNDDCDIVKDPDSEIQGAVATIFRAFRTSGSAFGVVQHFVKQGLQFPRRAYGGVWDGKVIWGRLTHSRALSVLKNPSYAGSYVYGRYKCRKSSTPEGEIQSHIIRMPMPSWQVHIKDHHEYYITWDDFLENQTMLERNRTNTVKTMLPGPAREGMTLLQGLLICATCGRKLTVRYTGNGGIYPTYQCSWRHRDGLCGKYCMSIRSNLIDTAIAERILQVTQPDQLEIALKALQELERRDTEIDKQWQMRIERANYSAELAQRRYEEVDPSNRLVAANLEKRWNDALIELEECRRQHEQHRKEYGLTLTEQQKQNILSIAQDLPRLWNATTTKAADRKRIIRLLIKDITVEKNKKARKIILHIRWQGGATEDMVVDIPPPANEMYRCPQKTIDEIRHLANTCTDPAIVKELNRKGLRAPKGGQFTVSSVRYLRHKYSIAPLQPAENEISVNQLMKKLSVSRYVVYYWIEQGVVKARRNNKGSPYWIIFDAQTKERLQNRVTHSSKIPNVYQRSAL
ncbi:MAG: recombinase family protein [Tannerellaceae bacterium]|nr:recombinase family protein [Tannerellaceae bacterium]